MFRADWTLAALLLLHLLAPSAAAQEPVPKLYGVNVAGAEFGEQNLPGVMGADYLYPAVTSGYGHFAARGLTLFRLPVRWERLQPAAFGELSAADLRALVRSLDAVEAAGGKAIVDLHNFGRRHDAPLGAADAAMLADVWRRLAAELVGHPAMWGYELMNEPHDLPGGSAVWAELAQAATDAIRQVDRGAWVLVPGYSWQNGAEWPWRNPTLDVRDPSGRLIYAAHIYFDRDYSGRYRWGYEGEGARPERGAERVRPFLGWLAERGAIGMVTEYGVPDDDPRWLDLLAGFMDEIDRDARMVGGVYWAAGPWWGQYPLSVEPRGGAERPQLGVLARFPSRGQLP
jgi:endoglucanase